MDARPIGIFDSGLGGLTVVRELRQRLPSESIVYFGDMARLPYGTKSRAQIQRFSIENTHFLIQRGIKALVVACNSSSSAAFPLLKRRFRLPMVSVVEPAVEEALERTRNRKVGIIGTAATVESRVYEKALRRKNSGIKVYGQSCPLFVPLVEEGWLEGGVTERVVEKYLRPLVRKGIDTLILGCTHYPLLVERIREVVSKRVELVDSAGPTVERLTSLLESKGLLYAGERRPRFQIFTSDLPRNFVRVGERFLGKKLPSIQVTR